MSPLDGLQAVPLMAMPKRSGVVEEMMAVEMGCGLGAQWTWAKHKGVRPGFEQLGGGGFL